MRRLAIALTAAATLGLLGLGAAPASADPRPLPVGDSLYGIACPYYSSDSAEYPNMQLIGLDSITAEGTLIGGGTPALTDANCGGQGAWNPVTATAYAIAFDFDGAADPALVTIDTTTGVSTFVAAFHEGVDPVYITAIAISTTGAAYASGQGTLFKLDLSTAGLIEVGPTSDDYAMAFDPSSGVLYTLDSGGELSTIDPATGVQTSVGPVGASGNYSLVIDTSGILWFGSDINLGGSDWEVDLYSADPDDLANTLEFSGRITIGEASPYVEALLLVYPATPQLAATGSTVEPLTLGLAMLLLVGGAAAVVIRRTRRA